MNQFLKTDPIFERFFSKSWRFNFWTILGSLGHCAPIAVRSSLLSTTHLIQVTKCCLPFLQVGNFPSFLCNIYICQLLKIKPFAMMDFTKKHIGFILCFCGIGSLQKHTLGTDFSRIAELVT